MGLGGGGVSGGSGGNSSSSSTTTTTNSTTSSTDTSSPVSTPVLLRPFFPTPFGTNSTSATQDSIPGGSLPAFDPGVPPKVLIENTIDESNNSSNNNSADDELDLSSQTMIPDPSLGTPPVSPKRSAPKRTLSQRSPSKSLPPGSSGHMEDDGNDSGSISQHVRQHPNKKLAFTPKDSSSTDSSAVNVPDSQI
jgi:hypothetical protein